MKIGTRIIITKGPQSGLAGFICQKGAEKFRAKIIIGSFEGLYVYKAFWVFPNDLAVCSDSEWSNAT
jgi:hypothetical protein